MVDVKRRQCAVGAGAIFDDDGLPERFAERVRR